MTRPLFIFALPFTLILLVASAAQAALPPFELAQKSLTEHRKEAKNASFDLTFTQTGEQLREWELTGQHDYGSTVALDDKIRLGPQAPTLWRLVWIALLAPDPIAALTKSWGFVDTKAATVGVHDGFVYIYGANPRIAVYRDFKRLGWFEVRAKGNTWRIGLSWSGDDLLGLMVTHNGNTVLTARSAHD